MGNEDATTKPTIEAVLERISSLRDEMRDRFDRFEVEVRDRFDRFEAELKQLRSDMNDGFRRLERKIDLLNRDILDLRADHEHVLQRVEKLESKVQ